ncbi:MAG: hypothetical protein FJY77_03780 [Candidatus Altiarchaeales archaeon]|nr:hypothetical protein [Candidatus Altiarchaeales archaeon]
MIPLKRGSLEEKIVRSLGGRVVEKSLFAREMKVKESVLDVSLRRLASSGLVGLDVLPDKVYVRLVRHDHSTVGVKPTQKRKWVKKVNKTRHRDYEGVMFR